MFFTDKIKEDEISEVSLHPLIVNKIITKNFPNHNFFQIFNHVNNQSGGYCYLVHIYVSEVPNKPIEFSKLQVRIDMTSFHGYTSVWLSSKSFMQVFFCL